MPYLDCTKCGTTCEASRITLVKSGKLVCSRCLDAYYTKCHDCGKYEYRYDTCTAGNGEDRYRVCSDCRRASYFTCNYCGAVYTMANRSVIHDRCIECDRRDNPCRYEKREMRNIAFQDWPGMDVILNDPKSEL